MRTFSSADAKNHFGELIDAARLAPVAVTKYDKPFVVVMGDKATRALLPPSKIKRGWIRAPESMDKLPRTRSELAQTKLRTRVPPLYTRIRAPVLNF